MREKDKMAKDREDFSAVNSSIMAKWTRDKERAELSAEHSKKQTQRAISNLLKSQANRTNIAKELKAATEHRQQFKREAGYGANEFEPDALITGFEEELQDQPWNRDLDE